MKNNCLFWIGICLLYTFANSLFTTALSGIESSASYILVESTTGQVLAQQRSDDVIRPASTSKIMTALIALENGEMNQPVTVSKRAVLAIGNGGMNIGIKASEPGFTLEQMLNVMLIRSANETANIIAENTLQAEDLNQAYSDFLQFMNNKAIELGAYNTTFKNPSGIDDLDTETNYTTARDMAAIARYAMRFPLFRKIVAKNQYSELPKTPFHKSWPSIQSTNRLLKGANQYPYTLYDTQKFYTITGIKTGYTSKAQGNLIVSAINDEGLEFIAAIMNVRRVSDTFQYANILLKYAFENMTYQTIVTPNQVLKKLPITNTNGTQESIDLISLTPLTVPLPIKKETWDIQEKVHIPAPENPIFYKNAVMGTVQYTQGDTALGIVHLHAKTGLNPKISDVSTQNKRSFLKRGILIGSFVFSIFIILVIIYLFKAMKKLPNTRNTQQS